MKLFPNRAPRFGPPPKPFFCAVFHANRVDLTYRAVKSLEPWWPVLRVIDNSPSRELTGSGIAGVVPVITPPAPLTFSQSMEACRTAAIREGKPWWAFLHNDAEASPEALSGMPQTIAQAERHTAEQAAAPWAVCFTNYDALAAFSTSACASVGPWDTNIPQYGAESDYYRRIALANYRTIQAPGAVAHAVSQTILSDAERRFRHEKLNNAMMNYYAGKWGGPPNAERFRTPWNGEAPQ